MTKFLPHQAAIEKFGSGGFRFHEMSHQGSLLVLPSGMRAWRPLALHEVTQTDFAEVLAEREQIDFLLIGTGANLARPNPEVLKHLRAHGVNMEIGSTSSAVHTYNILVAEDRRVAAALIAVAKAHG